jgi:hypothetical protein
VYPTYSQHKCITLIPLPLREFTPAPIIVAASLAATSRPPDDSNVHHNDGIMVIVSTDPFGPSFLETITLSGIHPTLGVNVRHDVDRQSFQLVAMMPGTPSHRLPQCKSRLRHAFLISVDSTAVHTIRMFIKQLP